MTVARVAKDPLRLWTGVSKRSGYRTFRRGRKLRGYVRHVNELERVGKSVPAAMLRAVMRLVRRGA